MYKISQVNAIPVLNTQTDLYIRQRSVDTHTIQTKEKGPSRVGG